MVGTESGINLRKLIAIDEPSTIGQTVRDFVGQVCGQRFKLGGVKRSEALICHLVSRPVPVFDCNRRNEEESEACVLLR